MSYKYNKKNPPIWGELTLKQFEKEVDKKSFPICESCGQPIYNPSWYDEEMCGPCMTGESAELMRHKKNENKNNILGLKI